MSANNIRNIDFRNFEYRPACTDSAAVEVIDGEAELEDGGFFSVSEIVFGDLTGNGTEEAVVLTTCNTGGTGVFHEGFIFTIRGGAPTLLARIEGGDTDRGGIRGAVIEDGRLLVERSQITREGEHVIEVTTHRLVGNQLVTEGVSDIIPFNGNSTDQRIQFERGRTTTTFENRETISNDTYILSARAGQTLIVNVASRRDNIFLVIQDVEGAPLLEGQARRFSGRLSATGDYSITVSSTNGVARYTLEVTIPAS